jgi:hypothetical protein
MYVKTAFACMVLVLFSSIRAEAPKVFLRMPVYNYATQDRAMRVCRAIRADLTEMGISATMWSDEQVPQSANRVCADPWQEPGEAASVGRELGYDWVITGTISHTVDFYTMQFKLINVKHAVTVSTTERVFEDNLGTPDSVNVREVSLSLADGLGAKNGVVTARKHARSNLIRTVAGGVGVATVAVVAIVLNSNMHKTSYEENTRDAVFQW